MTEIMRDIPTSVNQVTIEFASSVKRKVHDRVVKGLQACIKSDIAAGFTLEKIYISSASDSHKMPSRHAQSKAVDISRINGKRMSEHYESDPEVKAITQAIQDAFENFAHCRENFGPHIKRKLGGSSKVGGHNDHVHLSVN